MADGVKIDFEANLAPLLGSVAGLAGAIAGAFTFKKMIDNATEAEDAVNKLNIAMKLSGTFSEEASESFRKYAASLQATTGFSDDMITKNASMLVSIGKLSGEGLERATKAALDLSVATGRDATTMFDLLSKAAAGQTSALTRYGIVVDKSIPQAEKFNAALKLIETQMGGMAESQLLTFSGAMQRVSNGFGDILEELGKLITQSPVVRTLINQLASVFESMAGSIEAFGKSGDSVGQSLLAIGSAIANYVLPPLELLFNAGNLVWDTFKTGLQAIVTLLATVADGYGQIGNALGLVSDETAQSLTQFKETTAEVLGGFAQETQDSLTNMFRFDTSLAAAKFTEDLAMFAEQTKPGMDNLKAQMEQSAGLGEGMGVGEAFSTMLGGMSTAATEFAQNASKNFKQLGATMFQAIGNGTAQAFAAFGKALAKGENALAAFANAMLSALGSAAVQMGAMFILQGIAYTWAGMPNGPPLIAAGAALAAVGGVLMALGGGGETASVGGIGGGGGGTTGGTGLSGPDGLDQLQERRPDTSLVVNIQGNVLDRRQTGLEIAEVIQETFGSNGINFQTA